MRAAQHGHKNVLAVLLQSNSSKELGFLWVFCWVFVGTVAVASWGCCLGVFDVFVWCGFGGGVYFQKEGSMVFCVAGSCLLALGGWAIVLCFLWFTMMLVGVYSD